MHTLFIRRPTVKDGERTGNGLGFGAKKDRGTGFSVLAAREMEREPFFAPSLTLAPCSETARKRLLHGVGTVQFNSLTYRDQFTKTLFRANLIEKPFQLAGSYKRNSNIVSDQLKRLFLGLHASIFKFSCFAELEKKQKNELNFMYNTITALSKTKYLRKHRFHRFDMYF